MFRSTWRKPLARVLSCCVLAATTGAVGSLAARPAGASTMKQGGSPPLVMPGTLLIEAGTKADDSPVQTARKLGKAVADAKRSPRTCAAALVQMPGGEARVVTARHCIGHGALDVLDEEHELMSTEQFEAAGDVDLAVVSIGSPAPWRPLPMRSATSVAIGERLCAWHMRREDGRLARERICGRVVGRTSRTGAAPLLVMNHPFPAGTSGSALVDPAGRVVGIVVASTGFSGIAEPIDEATRIPTKASGERRTAAKTL